MFSVSALVCGLISLWKWDVNVIVMVVALPLGVPDESCQFLFKVYMTRNFLLAYSKELSK